MTSSELLSPKTFYETSKKVIRNFSNWRFYKKTMRTLRDNGSLTQYGMRLDLRGRAYYVLNLEPETLMMGTEVLELEKSRVFESINSKKIVFEDSGLTELIEARTERLKSTEYYAYLIQIKYRSTASIGNILYCITWLAVASVAAYFLTRVAMHYETIIAVINNTMTTK